MLGPDDSLPTRPRRIVVAGASGSGKTTTARRVALVLAIPYVELDGLYHGPGWIPRETFAAEVESFVSGPRWVCEWQYGIVRPLLAQRADLMIWLDLPRRTVLRQVIVRTLVRRLRREKLWNGNLEPPLYTFFTDRNHIVRWAWSTHRKSAQRVRDLQHQRPDLTIVRLGSRDAVDRWHTGPLQAVAT